jgi:hypothetical protein
MKRENLAMANKIAGLIDGLTDMQEVLNSPRVVQGNTRISIYDGEISAEIELHNSAFISMIRTVINTEMSRLVKEFNTL